MRATSSLLSVMGAVEEFGRSLTKSLGAPPGRISVYAEVPFERPSGDTLRPDGVIVVERGRKQWTALVEVKTGTNQLAQEQIESYLDLAREIGADCVLTISNQIAPVPGEHPVAVDRRKTRRVGLHHRSWVAIVTEAAMQHEYRGVSDPDQAWILGELLAYLEDPKSGALTLTDMGSHWVEVRRSARDGSLRAHDSGVADVVARWDELIHFLAMVMGRELGANVQRGLTRKERTDPAVRHSVAIRGLVESDKLVGTLQVPDAIADIELVADLGARTISTSIYVNASREGRSLTRINWILRQLREAPAELRFDTHFEKVHTTTSEKLGDLRSAPKRALDPNGRTPRGFTLTLTRDMGLKRGGSQGSFIDTITVLLRDFYRDVVQDLRPWAPPAPRLREAATPEHVVAEEPEELAEKAQAAPAIGGLVPDLVPESTTTGPVW